MSGPAEAALRWAVAALGDGRITGVDGLREGGAPWLVRVATAAVERSAVLRTGDIGDAETRQRFATEVAALTCLERYGLATPRLIAADLDATAAGELATLTTVLPGSSRIPVRATPERLRAFGAATARLGQIPREPDADLPLRLRPMAETDFTAGRPAWLRDAQELVDRMPVPADSLVLVHGDLWQGNTLWVGDDLVGIVDWDYAGVSPVGVDLGGVRLDAAIMFGLAAADDVLDGWRVAGGATVEELAYWDLVAALSMPADLSEWTPQIHDQGRTDLDPVTLNSRRDTFARAALGRL